MNCFDVNQLFVFDAEYEKLVTFNITNEDRNDNLQLFKSSITPYEKTVELHRNKKNNVLFTLNALNELQKDEDFIDWKLYKNCCLLTSNQELVKIPTTLQTIIKLGE